MSSVGSSGENARQLQKDFNKSMEEQAVLFYEETGLWGEYQRPPWLPINCSLMPIGKQTSSLESSEGWSSFCIDYKMLECDDVKT